MTPREPRPRSDVATLIGTAVAFVALGISVVAWQWPQSPSEDRPSANPSAASTRVRPTQIPARRAASTNAKAPTTKVPSTAQALGSQEHAQAAWYWDWYRSTRTFLVNQRQEPWWAVLIIWLVLGAIALGISFAADGREMHTLWSIPFSMGALTGYTWYFWPSFNTLGTIVTCIVNGIGSVALAWNYQHPIDRLRRRTRLRAVRDVNLPGGSPQGRAYTSSYRSATQYHDIPGTRPGLARKKKVY